MDSLNNIYLFFHQSMSTIETIVTKAFDDQKPGTSGLRKPTKTFLKENYVENFVQSIFNAIGESLHGRTLVVGGDGRFHMKECVETITKMAAANKVFFAMFKYFL